MFKFRFNIILLSAPAGGRTLVAVYVHGSGLVT
jgi:hypothetical protein